MPAFFTELPEMPNMRGARCAEPDVDPELFFTPPSGDMAGWRREIQAVCDGCPVRSTCLEYASVAPVEGWWAGLSHKQLTGLRGNKRPGNLVMDVDRSPCGTEGARARHVRDGNSACRTCDNLAEHHRTLRASGIIPPGRRAA